MATTQTTIDSTLGVVSTGGNNGLVVNVPVTLSQSVSNTGFGPYPLVVTAFNAAATIVPGNAGACTVAGGSPSALVLPLAASSAGSIFTIRSLSAQAHYVTASQEAQGACAITDGTTSGSKGALPAVIGSSVALMCDGRCFLVIGHSGSFTISGA